jgi:hypothetical protein
VSALRINYSLHPDVTPDGEVTALAAVYKFVLACRERKKAAPASRADEATVRHKEGVRDVEIPPGR